MSVVIFLLLAAFFYVGVYLYYLPKKAVKARAQKYVDKVVEQHNKSIEHQKNTMTYAEYRGYKIPMTVLEKNTMWDNMTREARNKALYDFKQAVKKGLIQEYK